MRTKLTLIFIAGLLMLTAPAAFACGSFGVTAAAALNGSGFGLQADFDGVDLNACYVQDNSPNSETVFSAFWRMRKRNSYTMDSGGGHDIFRAVGGGQSVIQGKIRFFPNAGGGQTYVQVQARRDDNTWSKPLVSIFPSQAGWKFEWAAASAPGANDGFMRLLKLNVDGTFTCIKQSINIDNDTKFVNDQRLGAMGAIGANTTGTMDYDDYQSFRTVEAAPTCNVTFDDSI